ncbi:hypothetical protein CPT_Moonbeam231 [Bacillus phage Moonbeam]|uniref:Uncharacterized protein n=1 Tax=Bacillus phage Moonbeam TaxID=1540091 RepID=A0A0A0RPS6_9CAUD|nr:hypothetical protein CPT_Moonbeam231 [Bacillus phage Moonbeam]AIW03629.1 hypothetical protein CPT_Moonbeam231 [Bacillus phage Moonbeam]
MNMEQRERWERITNRATLKNLGFNTNLLTDEQITTIYIEAGEQFYTHMSNIDNMSGEEYLHFARFFIWRVYKQEQA